MDFRKTGGLSSVTRPSIQTINSNFFEEFLDAFFPEEALYIDFSNVEFLSQDIFTDITAGEQRRIDILAKVKLKGEETVILVHVEPQSYYQKEFPERMFIYFSRIYEKYRKPILPIAVFSYNERIETPDTYILSILSQDIIHFRYLSIHLINKNWKDYIKNNNPVAAAMLSKMGYTEVEKVQVKVEFLRMIARMELDPARMALIYGFFETYLKLNNEEERNVMESIKKLDPQEAEQVLRLPNSYFDKGYIQGREEGRKDTLIKTAVIMLQEHVDIKLIEKVTGLKESEILLLKKRLK